MLPTPRVSNQQIYKVGEQSIKGIDLQGKKTQKTKDYNLEAMYKNYQIASKITNILKFIRKFIKLQQQQIQFKKFNWF
ncbi:unnamed protein product [Paramecium sonneborni]|uniref:Uncharacterized protein n=1 Tax=Paramecium sonneborni TaxID=65129 RepID=A0A8S1NJ46_9CILI|nr:unnamed protein product [Paramecium sonneborni]